MSGSSVDAQGMDTKPEQGAVERATTASPEETGVVALATAKPDAGKGALTVVHVIDSLGAGGAQALVFGLATRIPESCVLSLHGAPTDSPFVWDGVYCTHTGDCRPWSAAKGIGRLLITCFRKRRHAQFVAHLNASTIALCVLRPLLRFRLLVMVHASPNQWPTWYRSLFRLVIRTSDLVVGGGEQHRSLLVSEGVASGKIVLAGVGSALFDDPPRAADRDVRGELEIASDVSILLNVARMVKGKGQAEIVRALARLKGRKVAAVIIGGGPEERSLKQLAAELGVADRVYFPGPRTDLHNFYSVASMFSDALPRREHGGSRPRGTGPQTSDRRLRLRLHRRVHPQRR
jgi:glycosyltransferase involved in cell wall biosynthesis